MDTQALRKEICRTRRELSSAQQVHCSDVITQSFLTLPGLNKLHTVGLYFAHAGEVMTQSLWQALEQIGKRCYLPILNQVPAQSLRFVRCQPDTTLAKNRYGIPEPKQTESNVIPTANLDIIAVPLVAFDKKCHRIGMGKGYYDRTFAFRQHASQHKPLLIGLAYEFQRTEQITPKPWDVAMDKVITEKQIYQHD